MRALTVLSLCTFDKTRSHLGAGARHRRRAREPPAALAFFLVAFVGAGVGVGVVGVVRAGGAGAQTGGPNASAQPASSLFARMAPPTRSN